MVYPAFHSNPLTITTPLLLSVSILSAYTRICNTISTYTYPMPIGISNLYLTTDLDGVTNVTCPTCNQYLQVHTTIVYKLHVIVKL